MNKRGKQKSKWGVTLQKGALGKKTLIFPSFQALLANGAWDQFFCINTSIPALTKISELCSSTVQLQNQYSAQN